MAKQSEGWGTFSLEELGSLQKKTINPQDYKNTTFEEYSMPAFDAGETPSNIKGKYLLSDRTCISAPVLLFNKLNVRQKRVWLIKKTGVHAVCSTEFLAYQTENINLSLLKQILLTDEATSFFEANSTGTSNSQKRITPSIFLNYSIEIPSSLPEQHAIAAALSDVDALLDAQERLIAKKRNIKLAAMQQLLTGKTRLPGFQQNGRYKQTELGILPEDWHISTISSFTECTAGGTPNTKNPSYWGGKHPWMNSGELHLKHIYNVSGRITDNGIANSSTKYIPKESVLIGLAGQGKTRGTVAIAKIALCTNQSIAAIFPSKSCFADYLFYNLDSRYTELRELSSGDGGRGGLNLKLIGNLLVPIPPLPEQRAIAAVLSDMDAELAALEARRDKLRAVKQGMMRELLTGRTRLAGAGGRHGQ